MVTRRFGWMALEVMVIALVYTVMSVIMGLTSPDRGDGWDLAHLLLVNLAAVLPVVAFVWRADGTWWSVGATSVLTLGALQTLVPQLEMALERQTTLSQLPLTTANALVAASIAVGVFLFMLPEEHGMAGFPPGLLLLGGPVAYLWRVLVLTAGYAGIHVVAMRMGRSVFEQVGRAGFIEEIGHRAACGLVVVTILIAVAAHLPRRDWSNGSILVVTAVVVCGAGRWMVVAGWPVALAATRITFRTVADVLVGVAAVWLFLPRAEPQTAIVPPPKSLPSPNVDTEDNAT